MSTIYALATARGKAGLGVVRISGPAAAAAAEALAGPLPRPRRAGLRRLRGPGGETLDEAVVLAFEAGASYTGEAVVELHCHGSPAILDAVLRALSALPDLRPAGPGEFTRRALENGRLDPAQVEGLADLIDAETEAQRRQAWGVFSGALGAITDGWRDDLVRALALIEATIDFAEEDVPADVWPEVRERVGRVHGALGAQIAGIGIAERIRDGFEVAIVGPPNVGKSTLMNRLSGRDAAITSPVAGTTRDVIEVRMDLGGLPVTVLDTAGLREGAGAVERLGIARARARAEAADLRVILLPSPGAPPSLPLREGDLVVLAKADRYQDLGHPGREGVSGLTGLGVPDLVERIEAVLAGRAGGASIFTRHRHARALTDAADHLGALLAATETLPVEIAARHLWEAVRALDLIAGRIDLEHVLDDIFSSFCIGK